MCGIQFKDRKRSTDLMFMMSLSETMDQLAMASSVCWYGHVLRGEDGHVLRGHWGLWSNDEREAKVDMAKAD